MHKERAIFVKSLSKMKNCDSPISLTEVHGNCKPSHTHHRPHGQKHPKSMTIFETLAAQKQLLKEMKIQSYTMCRLNHHTAEPKPSICLMKIVSGFGRRSVPELCAPEPSQICSLNAPVISRLSGLMIRCNFEAAELVNQDVLGKAEACKD